MTSTLGTAPILWPRTRVSEMLAIRYPIIQGPFGGGLSSVSLTAAVTRAGGLGSYGAHYLLPPEIAPLVDELRAATPGPFAVNLWVNTHDLPEAQMTRERFEAAVQALGPVYEASGAEPPPYPERFAPTFQEQFEALLAAAPPVFSFVFGIPSTEMLEACRARSITTIGTATTPDEAKALDDAGVDLIVASGFEAGGHRGAFIRSAEDSLVSTMPLVQIASEEVAAPVIAAGGIVDARGILAAHALGAEGVQIGTAFLATDESGATPEHRALLRGGEGRRNTRLTRAFSGRLARSMPNRVTDELVGADAVVPYPYQGYLLRPVIQTARSRADVSVVSLWSGQGAPLVHHTSAMELFEDLVDDFSLLRADPPLLRRGSDPATLHRLPENVARRRPVPWRRAYARLSRPMRHVPTEGLFETHLTVANLDASVAFYRDLVSLELAYRMDDPRVAFFWVGGRGRSMLGVWETGHAPNTMRLHTALSCTIDDVLAAPGRLAALGITPRGFHGEPVHEPVVIGWMPAAAVFFTDPDGHLCWNTWRCCRRRPGRISASSGTPPGRQGAPPRQPPKRSSPRPRCHELEREAPARSVTSRAACVSTVREGTSTPPDWSSIGAAGCAL